MFTKAKVCVREREWESRHVTWVVGEEQRVQSLIGSRGLCCSLMLKHWETLWSRYWKANIRELLRNAIFLYLIESGNYIFISEGVDNPNAELTVPFAHFSSPLRYTNQSIKFGSGTLNDRSVCSPHSYAYLENLKQWKANKLKRRGDSTHSHCCLPAAPSLCLLGIVHDTSIFQPCPFSPSCLSAICWRVFYHSEDQALGGLE